MFQLSLKPTNRFASNSYTHQLIFIPKTQFEFINVKFSTWAFSRENHWQSVKSAKKNNKEENVWIEMT